MKDKKKYGIKYIEQSYWAFENNDTDLLNSRDLRYPDDFGGAFIDYTGELLEYVEKGEREIMRLRAIEKAARQAYDKHCPECPDHGKPECSEGECYYRDIKAALDDDDKKITGRG